MRYNVLQQEGTMPAPESDMIVPLSEKEIERLCALYPESHRLLSIQGSQELYYTSIEPHSAPLNDSRRAFFTKALDHLLHTTYPPSLLPDEGVMGQDLTFSTAEHLNSITEPFTLNTVYNQALYKKSKKSPSLLTLACATIKVNHLLSPRSLYIGQGKAHLLKKKHREKMVLYAPPLDEEYARKNIAQGVVNLPLETQDKIVQWWDANLPFISECHTFWEQICILNQRIWKQIVSLNNLHLADNYLMIPQEVVVKESLLRLFGTTEENWFTEVLFAKEKRDTLVSVLDGVRGCWDLTSDKGTFLFWANVNGRPVPLRYAHGALISEVHHIRIRFHREEITDALREDRIIPATSLSLLYLYFYLGYQIFGGVLQCQYLPVMQRRIHQGNPLALTADELERIEKMRPDLYLNFEERTVSSGGMLRLIDPLPSGAFNEYKGRSFRHEIQGCLGYLLEIAE